MKRYILTLCILITTSIFSINAKNLEILSISQGIHDLSLYEFIFPLKHFNITFSDEIQLGDNCYAAILLGDEVVSLPQSKAISNWHNADHTNEEGILMLSHFSCTMLPLGQTYTLRVAAGSVVDLEDATVSNEEIMLPLVVPANLNHYFGLDCVDIKLSGDSPKVCTGCELAIGTEVDPIGSPIVYLKRNGETIGEYPAEIRMQDWDLSSLEVDFPNVILDEGAEYTLVLPANSCCSQFRSDLTNDELTIMIQEASSGITEVGRDADEDAPIYDLMGRRVLAPSKGVYLKAGKKILIR